MKRKICLPIGLGQNGNTLAVPIVFDEGFKRVARGEKHRQSRTDLQREFDEFPAVNAARHHDIRKQDIDVDIAPEFFESVLAVDGGHDRISQALQGRDHIAANERIVLNDQHCFTSVGKRHLIVLSRCGCPLPFCRDLRQIHPNRPAIAREAHAIGDTAATFGFAELSSLAEDLQARAETMSPEILDEAIGVLRWMVNETSHFAKTELLVANLGDP